MIKLDTLITKEMKEAKIQAKREEIRGLEDER